MKILVVFTGGTIGTCVKDGWLGVDDAARYVLLNQYRRKHKDVTFVTCSPYSVLSENLSFTELNLLQNELREQLSKEQYDGVIITHGTDTLQYTAAALEYAFGDCGLPMVLVSAAYPLEDKRTNGHANFAAAVAFIQSKAANGVFVSYKNENRRTADIHIASHLLQHREGDANVYSIEGTPFAEVRRKVNVKGRYRSAQGIGPVLYTETSGVLVVESYPGNRYDYDLSQVRAVLLKPYHSATLNTDGTAFRAFCERARIADVPVFVTANDAAVCYESSKLFHELGIAVLPYGTHIAAYMKLWVAVSLGRDIRGFMQQPIGNEML
ncbi:MAG: asparaginase [Clostridia bacterium]|nr:asparaginase [Clostridia bacterium]